MEIVTDPEGLKQWLIEWAAKELAVDADEVNPRESFMNYGMNSMAATMLVGDLEDKLACRLSPTLAWDYPNIEELFQHLIEFASH